MGDDGSGYTQTVANVPLKRVNFVVLDTFLRNVGAGEMSLTSSQMTSARGCPSSPFRTRFPESRPIDA